MAGIGTALPENGRYWWLIWLILVVMIPSAPTAAHDFWIEPKTFWINHAAGPVPAMLWVGDHGKRERSAITASRIRSLRSHSADGITPQMEGLALGSAQGDVRLSLASAGASAGAYVVALETDYLPIALPADQFNAYIADEGLTPAIQWRQDRQQQDRPGREIYCRRAKTILQVGPLNPASAAIVTEPVGLSLEILPEQHPALLSPGQELPVRVLFDGAALPGALIRLSDLNENGKPVSRQVTDRDGRARFTLPHRGRWLLSVVWTQPIPDGIIADFQTSFASLSFGFPEGTDQEPNP